MPGTGAPHGRGREEPEREVRQGRICHLASAFYWFCPFFRALLGLIARDRKEAQQQEEEQEEEQDQDEAEVRHRAPSKKKSFPLVRTDAGAEEIVDLSHLYNTNARRSKVLSYAPFSAPSQVVVLADGDTGQVSEEGGRILGRMLMRGEDDAGKKKRKRDAPKRLQPHRGCKRRAKKDEDEEEEVEEEVEEYLLTPPPSPPSSSAPFLGAVGSGTADKAKVSSLLRFLGPRPSPPESDSDDDSDSDSDFSEPAKPAYSGPIDLPSDPAEAAPPAASTYSLRRLLSQPCLELVGGLSAPEWRPASASAAPREDEEPMRLIQGLNRIREEEEEEGQDGEEDYCWHEV